MRAVFGIVTVLLALAMVGLLVKNQLSATSQALPTVAPPSASGQAETAPAAAPQNIKEQSQSTQQQVKQSVETLLQQPRGLPEASKP